MYASSRQHCGNTTGGRPAGAPYGGTRVGRNIRAGPGGPRKHNDQQGAHDVRPVGSKYLLCLLYT
ncbi:hypothetical protein, partial [Streptomyces sp. NRRL S-15]|uniref:hypothetical protein n=1 Tax=Streptomyces sp. NRRL S-15 TaxID=1463886 RepID=UPI001F36959F